MVFDWFITNDFILMLPLIVGLLLTLQMSNCMTPECINCFVNHSLQKSHIATLIHDSSWVPGFILQPGKVTACPWLSNIVPHHFIRPIPTGFQHSFVSLYLPLLSNYYFFMAELLGDTLLFFSVLFDWGWAEKKKVLCCILICVKWTLKVKCLSVSV